MCGEHVWRCGGHVQRNLMGPRMSPEVRGCDGIIYMPRRAQGGVGCISRSDPSARILSLTAADLWCNLGTICETCERLGLGHGLTAKE